MAVARLANCPWGKGLGRCTRLWERWPSSLIKANVITRTSSLLGLAGGFGVNAILLPGVAMVLISFNHFWIYFQRT